MTLMSLEEWAYKKQECIGFKEYYDEYTQNLSNHTGEVLSINYDLSDNNNYNQNLNHFKSETDSAYCDVIWDGILCWPRTKAGSLSLKPCPYFGPYIDETKNFATKYCLPNGSWYYDEKLNQTWTNYTQCLIDSYHGVKNSTAFRKWFPLVKTVSQTGYSVSLTTLIIAIIIFSSIKKLRCARNRLHLHLFISFSMRAFMALLKDALFLKGVAMSQNLVFIEGEMFITEPNAWICKLITTAWEYFILANYIWILMEGLYLHNLIFTSLFSDNSAITMYVCFGWGVPSFFTIAWAFSRIYYEDTLCWTTHTNKLVFMLIRMPIVLSVLTSFVLFLNIVRVLLVKLNSVYIQRRKVRYRRLVRSTLVLVPLFGVHYSIFLAMSYADLDSKPMIMLVWLFCDQFLSSFQGFCVAMLYCLLNGEVRAELKRKFTAWKYRERGQRFTSYATMSFRAHSRVSIPLTEIRKPS